MEASGGLSPETQIAHSRTGLSRSTRSERPHRCGRGYTGSEDATGGRHAPAKQRQWHRASGRCPFNRATGEDGLARTGCQTVITAGGMDGQDPIYWAVLTLYREAPTCRTVATVTGARFGIPIQNGGTPLGAGEIRRQKRFLYPSVLGSGFFYSRAVPPPRANTSAAVPHGVGGVACADSYVFDTGVVDLTERLGSPRCSR